MWDCCGARDAAAKAVEGKGRDVCIKAMPSGVNDPN